LTDAQGQPVEWLKPYIPTPRRKARPAIMGDAFGPQKQSEIEVA